MGKNLTTIKLSEEARRKLRLIAASTGETMIQAMDRLTEEELKKLGLEKEKDERNNRP